MLIMDLVSVCSNHAIIPILAKAEVKQKKAPISFANAFASSLVTSSLSNKSHLLPASPNTLY